jgi:putative transposase
MQNQFENHRRKSIRMEGYDYTQSGGYFITIVTQGRKNLFGEIIDDQIELFEPGKMIERIWVSLPDRFPQIELGEHVVMPNHFHGIVINHKDPTQQPTELGTVIGAFKSITTHEYILGVKANHWSAFNKRLWQRNYFEHIIRDEMDDTNIREYIYNNPIQWALDQENPDHK